MQRIWIPGLAAIVVLAACDNDPIGTEGDSMSEPEALAFAASVGAASAEATDDGILEITAAGPDAGSISFRQQTTHPCQPGGSVEVVLDVDVDYDRSTSSFELVAAGSLTHDNCALDADGTRFTFNGDPALGFTAYAVAQDGAASAPWTNTALGAFTWSAADGREGRCVIDVEMITDIVAQERTIIGEICDHTIDQRLAWQ